MVERIPIEPRRDNIRDAATVVVVVRCRIIVDIVVAFGFKEDTTNGPVSVQISQFTEVLEGNLFYTGSVDLECVAIYRYLLESGRKTGPMKSRVSFNGRQNTSVATGYQPGSFRVRYYAVGCGSGLWAGGCDLIRHRRVYVPESTRKKTLCAATKAQSQD
jgi:hypothetical protein